MVSERSGRWRRCCRPLVCWGLLAMLGCGATSQAEDATVQAAVKRSRELLDAKQYPAARAKADEALKRAPDNPQALYLRGLAGVALKDWAKGRDDLEAARRSDPLLLFAPKREEYDHALKLAQDNTMTALSGVKPPAKASPPTASAKATSKAAPAKPGDTLVAALRARKAVFEDRSERAEAVLGPDQLKALGMAATTLAGRGLTLKVVVLKAGADAPAEARRLAEAAGLTGADLLLVASADGKLGAAHPTLAPDEIQAAVAEVVKANPQASLAGKLLATASVLGKQAKAPTAIPEPKPLPPTAVPPTAPTPEPLPWPLIGGGAAGGVALVLVVLAVRRMLRRRRLALGFASARPAAEAVAALLAGVAGELLRKRDRGAEVALEAAELAWFEAQRMLAAAVESDVGDIARVERAVRLLDEARAKLAEAQASLANAPERPGQAPLYCFFTARPLRDRHEADLVAIRRGELERKVLAARQVGETIRRGALPDVRVADLGGTLVHWARAAEFDPLRDFYRDGPRVSVAQLAEPFFADPSGRAFVETDERPDYRVNLG